MTATLYFLSIAATLCTVIGLGFGIMGDWLLGGFLFILGIANAVRFWQIFKA